jgi:tetratricopeptide (TPR) repeat protein
MSRLRTLAVVAALLSLNAGARAGLYYSGETFAELPSQWRGFLLDQRTLRNIAIKPTAKNPAGPARVRYQEAAARLEKLAQKGQLKAEDVADLGALYVRLGQGARAVEVLRAGQRRYPKHFHLVANLGTAYQLQGDLTHAADCLRQAVRLAPGKYQKAEELHLKLVRLRQRQSKDKEAAGLDDFFGIRYVGESGRYEPGKLAAAQRKKLPPSAAAVTQQLALWLPADGRLLWQLAELANAHGDVRSAAAMMDGCVTHFGMKDAELRKHRQLTRAAADELARAARDAGSKAEHGGVHSGTLAARSKRPLLTRLDGQKLPPISAKGVNTLPWEVLAETTLDRQYRPTFPKYLKELDGKTVSLAGFMQPLNEDLEQSSFMLIEYPVGCWYCEMPEMTGIALIELKDGKSVTFTRGLVKVVGKLTVNAKDPENFLYTISQAKVAGAD